MAGGLRHRLEEALPDHPEIAPTLQSWRDALANPNLPLDEFLAVHREARRALVAATGKDICGD